jgi:hypothetical protein
LRILCNNSNSSNNIINFNRDISQPADGKYGISGKLLILYAIAYCLLVHGSVYQDSHPWRILVYGIFAASVFFKYLKSPINCGITHYISIALIFYGITIGLINFHRSFFSWYSLLSDLIALSGFLIGTMLCATKSNMMIMKILTNCFHYLFLLAIIGTLWSIHSTTSHQRLANMSIITAVDYCIRLFPIALYYKRLCRDNSIKLLGSWLLILVIIAIIGSRGSLLLYVACSLLVIFSSTNKITLSLITTSLSAIVIFSAFYLVDIDIFSHLKNRITSTKLCEENRFYEMMNLVKDANIELLCGRGLGARNHNHNNFKFSESFCTMPHITALGFMYKCGILGFLFFWLFPLIHAIRLIFSRYKMAIAFATSLIIFKLGDCIGGTWDSIGLLFFSIVLFLNLQWKTY